MGGWVPERRCLVLDSTSEECIDANQALLSLSLVPLTLDSVTNWRPENDGWLLVAVPDPDQHRQRQDDG
jgi:hypothetical protein